ncbi:DNA methyltransferase [Arthrobacter sp. PAMC25284]|uniref:DNA methyltransferase n=1 Tax=Arthrobacter sp. PAMC25284 TaxID=2861279 RepID=UPI001C628A6D|nr:site-specific DNA-methyltransferase [Arthrobacter sp. PAMC25284]QYF88474.1 site-specific DNA-methyltransferase [Arthrobacter sp. PAMC25284]
MREEIICGDSREVLRRLADEGVLGSARLIYADPPFNTRRTDRGPFRDHRSDTDWADLLTDVASGAQRLLQEDGSFWLHTNDRQSGLARTVCDQVFGSQSYLGSVVWERTRRPSFRGGHLASTTDQILIYARDRKACRPFTAGVSQAGKRIPLAHRGNPTVTIEFPANSVQFGCADGAYAAGEHSSPGIVAALLQEVTIAGGRNLTPFRFSLPSRYSPAKVEQLIDQGVEWIVPKVPFRPSHISPGGRPKLVNGLWSWQLDAEMPTNEDAYKEQLRFGTPFPFAKPVGLIARIIEIATDPGDLVVDPFGGSGTTAVAAIQKSRSFIVVEEDRNLIAGYIEPRVKRARAASRS